MSPERDQQTRPDAGDIERGIQYCFQIGRETDSPGVILCKPNVIRWQYETRPRRSPYSLMNLLKKPDFVITNPGGQEVLQVRRVKRLPPSFEMIEHNQVVAKIAMRSILRNKYRLEFKAGPIWTFCMPLFTVFFWGESTAGTKVWVRVGPSKKQWNLLAEPGVDSVHLLSGLAFIHREWWCYN
jgi:hypothetical protein